jgi:phage virion morphogenesis protein
MSTNFSIKIRDADVKAGFDRLNERLKNMSPILEDVWIEMFADVPQHFLRQEGPRNRPWKPSKRAIAQSGQTLRDNGDLLNSINRKKITKNKASLGTNVPYARTHDEGLTLKYRSGRTLKMPQREFMYISEKGKENIEQIIGEGLVQAFVSGL